VVRFPGLSDLVQISQVTRDMGCERAYAADQLLFSSTRLDLLMLLVTYPIWLWDVTLTLAELREALAGVIFIASFARFKALMVAFE